MLMLSTRPDTLLVALRRKRQQIARLKLILACPTLKGGARLSAQRELQDAERERGDMQRALERVAEAQSSCSHTRPQERPRAHTPAQVPELWS